MTTHSQEAGWQAGMGCRDITPQEAIWLAGYAARSAPSTGIRQRVYAKALALRVADGPIAVLVTSDLIGYSAAIVEQVRRAALERFELSADRLLLAASHSHSAPLAADQVCYPMSAEQRAVVARYNGWIIEQLVETIGAALERLSPVDLSFGQGLAGFGVNRRRSRPGRRHLPGPVDQDVPVLAIRDRDGKLLTVVFGYTCHATTTATQLINGDYPGYAQAAIQEAHPGALAMFVAGCGADINPLPRGRDDLPKVYGDVLALAVREVLGAAMQPLPPTFATALGTVRLPLQSTPSRAQLQAQLAAANGELPRRMIQGFLEEMDIAGGLRQDVAYDVAAWKLGGLTWIALAGEVVVDFALRFKAKFGWDNTWTAAYFNEAVGYIPSERVLREGDYEGRDAMIYFGNSAPFAPGVEEILAAEVERVVSSLNG